MQGRMPTSDLRPEDKDYLLSSLADIHKLPRGERV